MAHVFLCHAGEDKAAIVDPLHRSLEDHGIKTWYDRAELRWGDSLTTKINYGLAHSDNVIVVLSSNFLNKGWPNRELNAVLNLDTAGNKRILPLLVGSNDQIAHLREQYPLLHDKLYLHWEDTSLEHIVYEVAHLVLDAKPRPDKPATDSRSAFNNLPRPIATHAPITSLGTGEQIGHYFEFSSAGSVSVSLGDISYLSDIDQCGFITHYAFQIAHSIARGDYVESDSGDIHIELDASVSNLDALVDILMTCLNHYGIALSRVSLMLPEASLSSAPDRAIQVLDSFRSSDIRFGIADFGIGYTSLHNIQRMRISSLTIPSEFFQESGSTQTYAAIIKTIAELGRSLGLTVGGKAPFGSWTYETLHRNGIAFAAGSDSG